MSIKNNHKQFKKQFKEYERLGFTVKSIEQCKGAHLKVVFNEFPEPQFLSPHLTDTHSLMNNISRFRRLKKLFDSIALKVK